MLHGSTTMGVDDAFSDLDLWLLLDRAQLVALDALSPTRFFGFRLDGKEGHVCVHGVEEFDARIRGCDMDIIYQLRLCEALSDGTSDARRLKALASRQMPEDVRRALFMWHYVEMRGEHRSCDTPIERGDAVALLLGVAKTITHALRAAMVLDGQPYPYDKWLFKAAGSAPTGAMVASGVESLLKRISTGALAIGGPEKQHPIGLELREIRRILVEAARAGGIDGPWLDRWWLQMDAARAVYQAVRW